MFKSLAVVRALFRPWWTRRIRIARVLVKATHNTVEVIDDGPGIDEQYLEKLFERFWRQEQSALTGSGLGLAIVKEIAEFHNAKLHVECKNRYGGATFYVEFLR